MHVLPTPPQTVNVLVDPPLSNTTTAHQPGPPPPNIGKEVKLPNFGEVLTSVQVKTYPEEKKSTTKSLTHPGSRLSSVTFHVLQQHTPPNVVMMLDKKAIRNTVDVCLTGLHVGLTRIQNEDDIRILAKVEG